MDRMPFYQFQEMDQMWNVLFSVPKNGQNALIFETTITRKCKTTTKSWVKIYWVKANCGCQNVGVKNIFGLKMWVHSW